MQRHDIKIGLNICFLSFVFVNNLIDNICARKSFDFFSMLEHISLLDVQTRVSRYSYSRFESLAIQISISRDSILNL